MVFVALLGMTALIQTPEPPEPIVELCPLYWVFFDEGSARLTPQARSVIDGWAAFAMRNEMPRNRFTIETVAMDQSGSAEENLALSFRRGQAIVRYLAGRGFSASRFRVRATGQSQEPWNDPNGSPDLNRAQNRRATLILETTASNWRRVNGDLVC